MSGEGRGKEEKKCFGIEVGRDRPFSFRFFPAGELRYRDVLMETILRNSIFVDIWLIDVTLKGIHVPEQYNCFFKSNFKIVYSDLRSPGRVKISLLTLL